MQPTWKHWLPRLVVLVIICSILLSIVVARSLRRSYVEHAFNGVPVLAGSVPFPEPPSYRDPFAFCGPLPAVLGASFLTDQSQDAVLNFYEQYAHTSLWQPGPRGGNFLYGDSRDDPQLFLRIATRPIELFPASELTALGANAIGKKNGMESPSPTTIPRC